MPNRVTNTTDLLTATLNAFFIAKIANVLYQVANFSCYRENFNNLYE